MQVRIQQSGDDLTLPIPRSFAEAARLEPDSMVEVSIQEGKLVISPAVRVRPTLEELLAGVTDDNRHEEVQTGPAVGEEAW